MVVYCHRALVKRIIFTLIVFFLLGFASERPVFAQYDPGYKPSGEESVEACPRLEGDDKGLSGGMDTPGDVRQYRPYTGQGGLWEMRGDAGIDQARQVRGAWCGQVKSDPIQLQEDAAYNLRRLTQFCQERRWKFEQYMDANFATNPDANFRIPFAEEMARQWGGIWDAEHETEATIDTKERIRSGGSASQPLTSAEEAIRGQVITDIENKTGVAKMLTSLSEQDDLKRKFIDYVKTKTGKTQYENFTVNGTRLTDIPYPPQGANGKTDYNSSAYADWNKTWGPTWNKLALFPNERTTGEFKFDVCSDKRYFWWYGYPEVMKMTLAANTLFQTLQPKQIQDQMYTDKFTDLRDPLSSQQLIGDAFSSGTGDNAQAPDASVRVDTGSGTNTTVSQSSTEDSSFQSGQISLPQAVNVPRQTPQTVSQNVHQTLSLYWQAVTESLISFLDKFAVRTKQVFAQSLDAVVPNNQLSQRLLAQVPPGQTPPPQPGQTQDIVTVKTFVQNGKLEYRIDVTPPPFVEPGDVIADIYVNGVKKYPKGFLGKVLGRGTPYSYGSTGSGAQFAVFPPEAVPNVGETITIGYHNANNYQCSGKLCSQYTPNVILVNGCSSSTLADGTINNPCAPDLAGPLPPNQQPEETPVVSQCLGQICLSETKHCQLGCEICKRAQLGPSDTEMTGNPYKANHIVYGQDQGARPVEWTWKPDPDPYADASNCAKDGGTITCRGDNPTGCYPTCNECKAKLGTPDYDIQKGNSNGRTVDLYNNVPFLEATWKLVAGNYNSAETGFLHAFTINTIKGQGNLNAQGCTSDPNVVFDPAGNFVPLPGASWAFWSGEQKFNDINKPTNDRPGLGETEPKVKQTVPSADEGRAKILFYRLGGLCNANKWVSGKELLPNNLQQKLNRTTNPFYQTSPYVAPTPIPSSVGTKSSATDSQTVGQKLNGIDATLPAGETPTVTTVTNPLALSSQPVFSGVQAGDQIVVYSQAGKVVIYRPQTNTIITQASVIKIALRNGTKQNDLFQAFAQDLAEHSPNIVITGKIAAVKSDYGKTILIDPSGTNKTELATLAVALGLGLGDLPQGEPAPTGADFLIIYGGPEVILRNGTTATSALTAFQQSLTQTIPTSTVTSTAPAATTSVATTFIADPTGKRTAEAQGIASALGIQFSPTFQSETAPQGNVFLIVLGIDKLSSQ